MAEIKLKNTANTEFSISHNGTRGAKAVTSDQIVVAVETINDFPTNAETGDTVIVKDNNRGGTFIYDATQSAVNNGGTVFDGWVRQYSGAVNVKWFGAKGDGVTDDTVAIQSAINNSRSLHIPTSSGQYIITDLVVSSPIHIYGNGMGLSGLVVTTSGGFTVASDNVTFSDFSIRRYPRHTDTSNTDVAINITKGVNKVSYNTYKNLFIDGFYKSIVCSKLWASSFDSIQAINTGIGIEVSGTSVNNTIINCQFTSNLTSSTIGISFSEAATMLEGWVISSNLIYGFGIAIYGAYCHNIKIIDNILDFCGVNGISFYDGSGFTSNMDIHNNYIAMSNTTLSSVGISITTNSSNSQVKGNRITNNLILSYTSNLQRGIKLGGTYSTNNIISSNTIKNCTITDIEAIASTVTDNICLSSVPNNIIATGYVTNNTGVVYYQRSVLKTKIGNKTITYDQAIPTAGSWSVGDICYHTYPAAGGFIGWVCTVAGTPGTWKTFGAITA